MNKLKREQALSDLLPQADRKKARLSMRMTPLDVQSHRFGRRFSGFDPDEVQTFLRLVAEDYESLLHENESLRDRVRRVETRVEELLSDEKLLKETLVSAQALGEELRRNAVKESEMLMSEAEVHAEKILDASHRRAARMAEEVREMRGLRTRLASALRSCIETHLAMLASLEDDPEDPVLQGKVSYLSRSERTARESS